MFLKVNVDEFKLSILDGEHSGLLVLYMTRLSVPAAS